jgi:1-acyl-sn-glycerol-3-phosphate acyltransferase
MVRVRALVGARDAQADRLRKKVLVEKLLHRCLVTAVRLYTWMMLQMDILWLEPFPSGPKLIVANHPSTTDPFYLGLLSRQPVSLLIMEALFLIPIFGAFLRLSGHIPVAKGRGRPAFEAAYRRLLRGQSVAIFPEGDLSPPEGGCCRPRTGAARLALLTGVPIIPVGIYLPRERRRPVGPKIAGERQPGYLYLRGKYGMTVGEPMHIEGDVEDREHVRGLAKEIMQRIMALAGESERRVNAGRDAP